MVDLNILRIIGSLLYVVVGLLVLQALFSWFPNSRHHPIVKILNQMTDPLIQPLRRIIPPVANIDISVMLAVWVLLFLARMLTRN